MEATPPPTSGHPHWAQQFDQSLAQQRERIREFLAAQQQRMKQAEDQLAQQLGQIAEELDQNRRETRQAKQDLEQQSRQVAQETETLGQLGREFDDKRAQWQQLQERAAAGQQALAEQVRTQQDELDRRLEELAHRQTQLSGRQEELNLRQAEIDEQETTLHHDRHELEMARAENRTEAEQHAAERDRLRQEIDLAQRRENQLSAEVETLRERERRLLAGLQSARKREESLQQQAAGGKSSAEELEHTKAECESLRQQLAEAEAQLAEAPKAQDDQAADGDYQRRYELAMEDIRELRAQNAVLQQRLYESQSSPARPAGPAQATLDWETQKQQILATLESEFDMDDKEGQKEAAQIENVVRNTDRLLADKDREIDDLKRLLEEQSDKLGSVAIGAAALGETLDADAIICEERERLKELQEECREKLRRAEIDISLERAKIAREKAEIEEKLRILEQQDADKESEPEAAENGGRPVRGRWLARLGLTDLIDEE